MWSPYTGVSVVLVAVFANCLAAGPECKLKIWSNHEIVNNVTVAADGLVILRCDARCVGPGFPPALKWYGRNNRRIPEVRGRVFTAPYSSHRVQWLFIQSFNERDVGEYKCAGWVGPPRRWTNAKVMVTLEADVNTEVDYWNLFTTRRTSVPKATTRQPPSVRPLATESTVDYYVYGDGEETITNLFTTRRTSAPKATMRQPPSVRPLATESTFDYTEYGEEEETITDNSDQLRGFMCDNGMCIPCEKRCNGAPDCITGNVIDLSDEKDCLTEIMCPDGQVMCGDTGCVYPGACRNNTNTTMECAADQVMCTVCIPRESSCP